VQPYHRYRLVGLWAPPSTCHVAHFYLPNRTIDQHSHALLHRLSWQQPDTRQHSKT